MKIITESKDLRMVVLEVIQINHVWSAFQKSLLNLNIMINPQRLDYSAFIHKNQSEDLQL